MKMKEPLKAVSKIVAAFLGNSWDKSFREFHVYRSTRKDFTHQQFPSELFNVGLRFINANKASEPRKRSKDKIDDGALRKFTNIVFVMRQGIVKLRDSGKM